MGKSPLVAVTDSVFPSLEPAQAILDGLGAELRLAKEPTPEGILAVARHADGLLVTYAKVMADVIEGLERCRVISRFGIGVDNVDIPAATRRGIVVTYVPDYCVEEVSDHALALLLALARKVVVADRDVRAGNWSMPVAVPIYRLRGRTLGLLGCGRIPQTLVPKAQGLGLNVIAHDPYLPSEVAARLGVELVTFDELLARAHYLSLHAPLTDETRGIINTGTLSKMRQDAFVINTARGPLVEEVALIEALKSGQIAGAALDVAPAEPLPADSPLRKLDNLILTPHTGFYSEEALVELQTKAAQEVASVLGGKRPRHPLNPEVLQEE